MRPSTERLRRGINDLGAALFRQRAPLDGLRMLPLGTAIAPPEQPIPAPDDPRWVPVQVGARWGGRDENAWFLATARVPDTWRERLETGEYGVALRFSVGRGSEHAFGWPEGLLYVNGRLQQGINRYHPDVLLRDQDLRAGGDLAIAARVWSGLTESDHRIQSAEITLLHLPSERLYHLLAQGERLVHALPEGDPLTHALHAALEAARDTLDPRDPQGASAALDRSAEAALAALEARLAELRTRYDPADRPRVTAVGHGHLDVAWLWQTRHTREKTARTFSVADALMDRYPEYVFLHTTPQVFAWLERDYPALFERVRERVAAGRFEAAGAMWLESDCNLVAGESLVRQIAYGQRYLHERLGTEYAALWLPDAFGYNAQLPQIMLRAGLTTFMTTKMSWSETNRIPFDTFRWRGLDGSEVLAHFITTPSAHAEPPLKVIDTYNGGLDVKAVRGVWERYRQKAFNSEVLLAFGYGDGGAGPSRQMIEQARALQELPGLPELRLGRADAFFERLRARVWGAPELPVWDGELYLEFHRGTYTTQAWLKRAHRQNEARLLLAESLDAWQHALEGERAPDCRAALDDAWRTLLLHEFHDILPGSSIGAVYADAREAMTALAATLDELALGALTALGAHTGAAGSGPRDESLVVYNPSPWPRDLLLALPRAGRGYRGADGEPLATQPTAMGVTDGDGQQALLTLVPRVPGRGVRRILAAREADTVGSRTVAGEQARGRDTTLENAFFRVEFNRTGEIVSLVDKRVPGGRELAARGAPLNRLEAYDDRPPHFDAWDIDAGFERKPYPVTGGRIELVESGPLRATMRVTHDVLESRVEQDISVYATIPRIDFATRIVWRNREVLLKAAFPLDLRTTHFTSETAYGAVERPTHRNTSWDQARFETPAHRWVDLSEAAYGVSLLNDGRYGHDVRDHVLRITLLRSPVAPDPDADQGAHQVTYSLYPHLGDWRAGGTVAEAYALNRAPLVINGGDAGAAGWRDAGTLDPLAAGSPEGVVVEAIKRAADGDGLIVRVYEAHGARVRAEVTLGVPVAAVTECDLLERPLREGESTAYGEWRASRNASHDEPRVSGRSFSFELRPHEVRTFRIS